MSDVIMKDVPVYVVLSAGAMDWRVDEVFLSKEDLLKTYVEYWDLEPNMTFEEFEDYINEDNEMQIKTSTLKVPEFINL